VEVLIVEGQTGRLVDFFDVKAWRETLANHQAYGSLRVEARRMVLARYVLKTKCLPKLIDFVEGA